MTPEPPISDPNSQPSHSPIGQNGRIGGSPGPVRRSPWKAIGIIVGVIVVVVLAFGIGILVNFLRPAGKPGATGTPKPGFAKTITDITQIATNPRAGFPGKNKIVICCMGIDDNWTNSDEVYTAGARTDTLFLLTLDLDNKTATMLSIPRDTYVPIAGTHHSDKINSAFSTGGPARTEATIQNWLGVSPDYYILLNIDATKKMVDALGGVDLNVEHEMNYDDDWGHLHVHLKPGFQHLDGDEAVSFARYRHGNHGISPEDGDERRMYRQHVLLRAMIAKSKTFSNVIDANKLIDTAMSCVRTDLTREQLADLAVLFHGMNQDTDMTAASLQGEDGKGTYGQYVMLVNQDEAKKYVDWMVNGNSGAGCELSPVLVANATKVTGLAAKASGVLRASGFTDCAVTSNAPTASPAHTVINDSGVPDKQSAADVARSLGLPNATITHILTKPNHLGWAPPPVITVDLGQDYATAPPPQATPASP